MTIILVGLNNQTAPLELRERLYLAGDELRRALVALRADTLAEVVIVCTCNRLEIYVQTEDAHQAVESAMAHLVSRVSLPPIELRPHVQFLTDRDAAHHLMRVAAGLESPVLGETEILGQIVRALSQAQQAGATGPVLARLFNDAIHAGKRARAETAISQHTLSTSHAAILMAKRHVPNLGNANVLVIGAGRMAELALRALKAHGATNVQVINRTYASADAVARRLDYEALEWGQLQPALRDADVVVTATGSPWPILYAADLAAAGRDDGSHPLILLDIAVPRNVHPGVRKATHVRLYDIDDLQEVLSDHRAKRQSEAAQVEAIVADELAAYVGWLNSRSAVSTIVALRRKAEALAAAEVDHALHRLPDLSDHERDVVIQMAERVVNKLLHAPTAALHERAADGDHYLYLHAVRELFDLETEASRE